MELPGKRIQDQLKRIKECVEKSRKYFEHNYKRFNDNKKFVFVTTLSRPELSELDNIRQPPIECNLLEAFISRLRGEFSKQEPSIEVMQAYSSQVDPQMLELVEGHARAMEYEARRDGVPYAVYTDLLSGGWSVLKLWTEYENDESFEQKIKFGRVFDPTLCGFDPLARENHKGDGRYAFELYPKTKEDFKEEYPDIDIKDVDFTRDVQGFNWSYENDNEDILLICDFYEKKTKKVKIVKIAETPAVKQYQIPLVMDIDKYKDLVEKWPSLGVIEQPPVIENSRITDKETIVRFRFMEDKVLEYVETDFMGFPLIFVGGNGVIVRDNKNGDVKEYQRSYIHNAIGTQKLANVALQSAGNELENMIQHKFMVAKESIPEEYLAAYTNYQVPSVMVYNAFLDKEGVVPGDVSLPPPTPVIRAPFPQEVIAVLQLTFQLMQNILGSFDASLGINNNQLSGVAIVEGATQSNAAAMPFVVGYIQGLNRLIQLWISLFPLYYITPRSIPVVGRNGKKDHVQINAPGGPQFKYGENDLSVKVEAGPNYSVQKAKTLQLIMGLAQSMPSVAEFIGESSTLPIIFKLLELPGAEELHGEVEKFVQKKQQMQQVQMEQAKQQAGQPNPLMMKMQLDQAKLLQSQQKMESDNQHEMAKNKLSAAELLLKDKQIDVELAKVSVEAKLANADQEIAKDKARAEQIRAFADMSISAGNMSHKHSLDHHRLRHETIKLAHSLKPKDSQEETD